MAGRIAATNGSSHSAATVLVIPFCIGVPPRPACQRVLVVLVTGRVRHLAFPQLTGHHPGDLRLATRCTTPAAGSTRVQALRARREPSGGAPSGWAAAWPSIPS